MRFAISLTAVIFLAFAGVPAAAPPADPLKGLTQKEAQAVVVSALKERDAKLANLRYVVRDQLFNVDADGRRKGRDDKVVEVRRHPKGHWMRQGRCKPGENEPYWEQITNVHGGQSRTFTRDFVKNEAVSSAGGGEAMSFRSFWFNQVAGFRATDDGPPRTVAQWVEDACRTPPRMVECSLGVHNGRQVVAVKVSNGFQQATMFWLDPARDWMTVRTDYFGGTTTSHNWSVIEVEKAEAVDGVWFPLEAHCKSGTTSVPDRFTEIRYTVNAATVGKVTEAELDVPAVPKAAAND